MLTKPLYLNNTAVPPFGKSRERNNAAKSMEDRDMVTSPAMETTVETRAAGKGMDIMVDANNKSP